MKTMENYARLIIEVGVNLKRGQELVIAAPVEARDFVRILAKAAYEAGARRVVDAYSDEKMLKLYLEHADEKTIEEFISWKINGITSHLEKGACIVNLMMPNPKLLEAIDPNKLGRHQKSQSVGYRRFYEQTMSGRTKWVIAALPSLEWAKMVFPDLEEGAAVDRLWEQLIAINRLEGDPVRSWKNHLEMLDRRIEWLNSKRLVRLVYRAPGTALEIELPEGHRWLGGAHQSIDGESFLPNIPTEEVFTLPHKYKVNGTVAATMPLNHSGNLIEGIRLTFKEGRVVSHEADSGSEILDNILSVDEGAQYLGEVALVPDSSPISASGHIFYNTLFDENASCHLALGAAYGLCHERYGELDEAGKDQAGINNSLTHVDFMVGSDSLDITGYDAQGTAFPIMVQGEWGI